MLRRLLHEEVSVERQLLPDEGVQRLQAFRHVVALQQQLLLNSTLVGRLLLGGYSLQHLAALVAGNFLVQLHLVRGGAGIATHRGVLPVALGILDRLPRVGLLNFLEHLDERLLKDVPAEEFLELVH